MLNDLMTDGAIPARARVLVIDDNPAIHDDFRKVLCRKGGESDLAWIETDLFGEAPERDAATTFEVDSAHQRQEGLEMVRAARENGNPYPLAFVDIRMPPGWDGVETIERLWEVDPDLQVVICSAYSDYTWTDLRARLGETDGLLILRKPFDNAEATQMAHALIRKWVLHQEERRRTELLESRVKARTAQLERANERLAEGIAERHRMEQELRLAQKLEAVGQLAAGIAHEINTPTQYVSDNVHFLRTAFEDYDALRRLLRDACEGMPEAPEKRTLLAAIHDFEQDIDVDYLGERVPKAFDSAQDGLQRIATIVGAMKEFGHNDNGARSSVDLNRALLTTLEVGRNEYKYVADIETDLGELPAVMCIGSELNQVFLNLIVNAAHAIGDVVGTSGEKGTIRLASKACGDEVEISVTDTGCGIPEHIQRRVFDPFFTTKEIGKGTGQGLAIARSVVVDKHGGSLTLESEPGRGATFTIRLPVEARAREAA